METPQFNLYADKPAFDILGQLKAHECDLSRIGKIFGIIDEEIRSFESYGAYLSEHLEWTAKELGDFLIDQGYDERMARTVQVLFSIHDSGKTLQPGLWKITEEKQIRTDWEKQERPKHGPLGVNVLRAAIEKSGIQLTGEECKVLAVAEYLMVYHHERLNGRGPFKKAGEEMCGILRAATIIDTFHGKLKAGKPADAIFTEMAEEKHAGEFDLPLLERFKTFFETKYPVVRLTQPGLWSFNA
jgi:HD-GYP domain-containing protein (c-di-GMP phosphodiesterase class II)